MWMSVCTAAAEAADSGGVKRRPLDAGLSGDQLRHARKRRMKETAPAVKEMLKPLYAARRLDKVRPDATSALMAPICGHLPLPWHRLLFTDSSDRLTPTLLLQEGFKVAAAAATADLAETVEVADMAADDVHAAVQRALAPLGLSLL
jgi:hypothetical protein